MEEYEYSLKQKEISKQYREETINRVLREFLIVFSGSISIIGFLVSLGFLIQMNIFNNITGNVIGSGEGNTYGLIIVTFILLVWSTLMIIWYRKEKSESGI